MLNNEGFDSWSGQYDQDVLKMQQQGYPFEGYYNTIGVIQKKIMEKNCHSVLDIGVGTGLLTHELYKTGMDITGLDFSSDMIVQARNKMPAATFVQADFSKGLPKEIQNSQYDGIISSYAIHHISDGEKVEFIKSLYEHLNTRGIIAIGDVAFESLADMKAIKAKTSYWDDSEFYMVTNQLIPQLKLYGIDAECIFTSSCSGVLIIHK